MEVKVLGGGCANCITLENNVKRALEGQEYDLVKVTDTQDIMMHGVMNTPALVVDGKVVSTGKVLSPEEIKELI
jgi:small redox-active disulfide protein 2